MTKWLWGLAVTMVAGCANQGQNNSEEGAETLNLARGELAPSVSFESTAEANFKRGEAAFADEGYIIAQRYFSYVRSKFPYSRFAVLSEIRIGDCQFARERYLESIDTFQNFIRMHPTHEKVAYSSYRIGAAYYEQIPGDVFLIPPSEEKDQTAVKDAERALQSYVSRFPEDGSQPEAKKLLTDVRKRLMSHERYVADFYDNLDRDRAYVGRLELIRRDFADVGLTDELLIEIAEVWARLGEVAKTKNAADELVSKFPQSELKADMDALVESAQKVAAELEASKEPATPSEEASKEPAPPSEESTKPDTPSS